MEQNKVEENRNLVKKLIEKFDKCKWTKNQSGSFVLRFDSTWAIHLGDQYIVVFRDGFTMIREIVPTEDQDKADLKTLWDMVYKRVQGRIDDLLDKLIEELDKMK